MKISEIKEVNRRVESGAWVKGLPGLPDVAVKVRGSSNSDYKVLLTKLANSYPGDELEKPEVQKEIQMQLRLDTILLDWRGIDDAEFSRETAESLLRDPDCDILLRGIDWASDNVARIGRTSLEDDAKNSSPSSAGSSPTE